MSDETDQNREYCESLESDIGTLRQDILRLREIAVEQEKVIESLYGLLSEWFNLSYQKSDLETRTKRALRNG